MQAKNIESITLQDNIFLCQNWYQWKESNKWTNLSCISDACSMNSMFRKLTNFCFQNASAYCLWFKYRFCGFDFISSSISQSIFMSTSVTMFSLAMDMISFRPCHIHVAYNNFITVHAPLSFLSSLDPASCEPAPNASINSSTSVAQSKLPGIQLRMKRFLIVSFLYCSFAPIVRNGTAVIRVGHTFVWFNLFEAN